MFFCFFFFNLTFCKYFVLHTSGKFLRIYLNVRFADQV